MCQCTGGINRNATAADAAARRLLSERTGDRSGRKPATGSPTHAPHADFESFPETIVSHRRTASQLHTIRRRRSPRRTSHRTPRPCSAALLRRETRPGLKGGSCDTQAAITRPPLSTPGDSGNCRTASAAPPAELLPGMALSRDDLAEDIRG